METFKDIIGYEGSYQVSNLGRVKSLKRVVHSTSSSGKKYTKVIQERIRVPALDRYGYHYVVLGNKPYKNKTVKIHRLVAKAFLGESNLQVNHKNGIRHDNRVENLEWVTASENTQHAFRMLGKKMPRGNSCVHTKIKEEQIPEILERIERGETQSAIATSFNVSRQTIGWIKNGHRKS